MLKVPFTGGGGGVGWLLRRIIRGMVVIVGLNVNSNVSQLH